MGIVIPSKFDEDEKERIKRIMPYLKKHKKKDYSKIQTLQKHRTYYTASFRIANRTNYKFKNSNPYERYLNISKHNSRATHHTTDLMQQDSSIDSSKNLSKVYIQDNDVIKNIRNIEYQKTLKAKRKSTLKNLYKQLKRARARQDKLINENLNNANDSKIEKVANKILDIESKINNLKKIDTTKTPRKNAKLTQEIVINVRPDTQIKDIENALQAIYKEIPIFAKAEIIRIDIHHDEGYINHFTGNIEYNHHAHIVFNNIDRQTGRTIFRQLTIDKDGDKEIRNKENLTKIRNILATELNLKKAKTWNKKEKLTKDGYNKEFYRQNAHKSKYQLQREANKNINYFKKYLPALEKAEQKHLAKIQEKFEKYNFIPYREPDTLFFKSPTSQEIESLINNQTAQPHKQGKAEALQLQKATNAQPTQIPMHEKSSQQNTQNLDSKTITIQNTTINAHKSHLNIEKTNFNTNIAPNTQNRFKDDFNANNPQSTLTTQHATPKESPRKQESHPAPAKSPAQDSSIPTKYADDLELAKLTKRKKALDSLSADDYSVSDYLLQMIKNANIETEREYYKSQKDRFEKLDPRSKPEFIRSFRLYEEEPKIKKMIESRIAELEKAEALQLQKATNAQPTQIPMHEKSSQQNIPQSTNAQQQGISNNKLTSSQPKPAPAPQKSKPKPTPKKSQGQGRGM